jgi:glycosyltransferase involved in cell wall biosynthesis
MKVLHIIPSVPKIRGGPSQVVVDMVKALRMNAIDAEIATTNDNGDELLNVPLRKCIKYNEVPIWFFSRFSPPYKPIREYAFSWDLTIWLWQNLSNYDIVHIHCIFSYASTIAMVIARLKNIPYIVTTHGLLCNWSLQQSKYKKQIYLKLIEQSNLKLSKVIHFTSQLEQQEFSTLPFTMPSFILPIGVSGLPILIPDSYARLREHLQIPLDEPIILFMSRLHPKKGLDYLIAALGKLTHHQFTFVIAGSGTKKYEQEIKTLVSTNNIEDRTVFAGFVDGETKNILLQGSDLFALTSCSESFAVVVLEAMANAMPVLVTPGVALARIVEQYQFGYVSELNILAIASAIEKYFICPQEAKDMGIRARQFIFENYTWEKIACQLEQVYRNVI